jgi:hypothetical protein
MDKLPEVYRSRTAMVLGDNQLFFPNCRKTPGLFAAFRKGYIEAGNIILGVKGLTKFSVEDFLTEYEEYAEDFLY